MIRGPHWRRIVRAAGWLLLMLATLEACARVDGWFRYGALPWASYRIENLYTRDALGARGRPHAQFRKWQLNRFGFRGPDPRPNTVKILCMGASETFGLYEQEGSEYPRVLERLMAQQPGLPPVEVVNVAFAGETLDQAAVRIPEFVYAFHPKWAVIYPSLANYIWHEEEQPPGAPSKITDIRMLGQFRDLLKVIVPRRIQDALKRFQIQQYEKTHVVYDQIPQESVQRFRLSLAQLVERLQAAGIQPVLVTHVTRFGNRILPEDQTYLLAWRKFYPMLKESGFRDMETRLNKVIRDIANQKSLPVVDLANEWESEESNFADFSHFTDRGAALMAQRLAARLSPLIRKQDAPN